MVCLWVAEIIVMVVCGILEGARDLHPSLAIVAVSLVTSRSTVRLESELELVEAVLLMSQEVAICQIPMLQIASLGSPVKMVVLVVLITLQRCLLLKTCRCLLRCHQQTKRTKVRRETD